MKRFGSIITVGVCPCWDVLCRGEGLDWGRHVMIAQKSTVPGGKALNVSKAVAWMGGVSTAAGLWGVNDVGQVRKKMAEVGGVRIAFTVVAGDTRENITVVDTTRDREMHLRSESALASQAALRKLKRDLVKMVRRDSICVFAGSQPKGELFAEVLKMIGACRDKGAHLVVDTSGEALQEIVEAGGVWMIKPNVEELRELLGEKIADSTEALIVAARGLRGKVENVLISRGSKGAILCDGERAWVGKCTMRARKLHTTVGCGDFLLGGVLAGISAGRRRSTALRMGIQAATARVWGMAGRTKWNSIERQIKVSVVEHK